MPHALNSSDNADSGLSCLLFLAHYFGVVPAEFFLPAMPCPEDKKFDFSWFVPAIIKYRKMLVHKGMTIINVLAIGHASAVCSI